MDQGKPGREVAVSLWCKILSDCPDGLTSYPCLRCRAPLDMHQPDCALPDLMLATCAECHAWHVIDCQTGAPPAFVALLPNTVAIRALLIGK